MQNKLTIIRALNWPVALTTAYLLTKAKMVMKIEAWQFKYGLIPEDIFTFVQLSTKEVAIKFGAYVCVSGGLAWLVYCNWPIKMSSSHATTLTCQRCKQMLPTLVDFSLRF